MNLTALRTASPAELDAFLTATAAEADRLAAEEEVHLDAARAEAFRMLRSLRVLYPEADTLSALVSERGPYLGLIGLLMAEELESFLLCPVRRSLLRPRKSKRSTRR